MSQQGTPIRRGLPRIPGGDSWPPARLRATGPSEPPASAAAPVAAPASAGAPVETRTPAPGTIRRGLPRQRGGDPWPPPRHDAAAPSSPSTPSPPAPSQPARTATADPAGTPQVTADAVDVERHAVAPGHSASASPVGPTRTLRRGLPRTPGGKPWPPTRHPASADGLATAAAVPPELEQPAAATEQGGLEAREAALAAKEAALAAREAALAEREAAADRENPQGPPQVGLASVPGRRTPASPPAGTTIPYRDLPRDAKPQRPRYRGLTRGQWAVSGIVGAAGLLFLAAMTVLLVRWLVSLEFVQEFLTAYPGETHLPEGAPVGLPAWLGWQHFFNAFLMVLIIRSGWQVRTDKRPTVFWTPRWSKDGKRKISLTIWFHQSLDLLWVVNGIVFIILLFTTGQWMRVVPTSWDVFPNALSALLQYLSLDWPTENGWVNYNSLQVIAYFATIFLAAPLAIATGVRMSGLWPAKAKTLTRLYPIELARAIHFPVMLYFVLFIIVHVTLVLATGALRNLNHMYAAQDAVNWTGFWIFFASLVVITAGWIAARPLVLAPIAKLFGKVGR